jgi:hypothetical protein
VDARLQLLGSVFEGYEWFDAELRRTVADQGLADHVEFLGFRTDVWPHLSRADVVLVPSVAEESFGNTAVEAVLAARPVVVSDSSGLREAVAGYRSAQAVAPGRTTDWADAIQRVATTGPPSSRRPGWTPARPLPGTPTGFRERLVAVVESLTADRSSVAVPSSALRPRPCRLDRMTSPLWAAEDMLAGAPARTRDSRWTRGRTVLGETTAPGVRLGTPPVLMYHSISPSRLPDPHALRVHPARLDRHLRLWPGCACAGCPCPSWCAPRSAGSPAGWSG